MCQNSGLSKYDYYNGNTHKHGNNNLFRRLDKDSIASQSATSLVTCTTVVYRNQMVCKGLVGSQRILLMNNINWGLGRIPPLNFKIR